MRANRAFRAVAIAACIAWTLPTAAGDPPRPSPRDRCPVCGMFVAGYPNWLAVVELEDDGPWFFDGPKDMFRFLHDPARFGADEDLDDDVVAIWVTDYYTTRPIDGRTAFFVVGSDVTGPMGAELVPFATREDADTFRADHGGDAVLAFADVGPEAIPR